MYHARNEERLSKRPWWVTRKERGTLAAVNEALVAEGLTLHPTKGFRKISTVRSLISVITNAQKSGRMGVGVNIPKSKSISDPRNHLKFLIKGYI